MVKVMNLLSCSGVIMHAVMVKAMWLALQWRRGIFYSKPPFLQRRQYLAKDTRSCTLFKCFVPACILQHVSSLLPVQSLPVPFLTQFSGLLLLLPCGDPWPSHPQLFRSPLPDYCHLFICRGFAAAFWTFISKVLSLSFYLHSLHTVLGFFLFPLVNKSHGFI